MSRKSLKFISRHYAFDIDDLCSMQDDPLCIHCMSWLINEIYSYVGELQIAKSDGLRFDPAFVTSKQDQYFFHSFVSYFELLLFVSLVNNRLSHSLH